MPAHSGDEFRVRIPIAVNVLSPTTYSVSAQYGFMFGGWEKAQADALAQGKQYCAAKGAEFSFIDEKRSGAAGFTSRKYRHLS